MMNQLVTAKCGVLRLRIGARNSGCALASRIAKSPEQLRLRNRSCALLGVTFGLFIHASSALALNFNVTLASLTNHNTSAYSAYNQANFSANFGTNTWVSQDGTMMPVDPTKVDESLNAITPGHVSKTDVHTLIPSRPDLRWFAHATPWFGNASHIDIGLTCNTTAYVAAMITDMKNRGFNGVVINWYGQGQSTDGVTQKVKSYLAGIPGNTFHYILMLDKGVQGGLSTNNLVTQIQYCQNQYFGDTNYEHEPLTGGLPILMFFGVRSAIGASAMSDLKAETGGNMIWVEQGTSYLSESWENQCFEWTQAYQTGVNYSDPFNLAGCTNHYATIRNSGKKAFGAMCGNFNGTLTKSVSWSMGKYLPSSNGVCVVHRAAAINNVIPANMTRMQWTTWSDWEEGTQIESGIENNFALNAQVNSSNVLSWTIASGDERTVDHYEIYAATNGGNAALLCSVKTGVYQTNLTQSGLSSGNYQLYVDAVAKPCIRDHISPAVPFVFPSGAPLLVTDLQPLSQTVYQGDPVSFSVGAGGTGPFRYQWFLNGQGILGATNSSYAFAAPLGTNFCSATISDAGGGVLSSTGVVIGVAGIFLASPSNYISMRVSFSGYTNGVALQNFPALVRLSTNIPGFSYSQFISPSDGADLRFTAANGREIPFQIEQWNPSGESQIWVQVPSLTSSNDYVTAYWSNAADTAMLPCNTNGATWTTLSGTNEFVLVYHLNQNGFPFADSTLQHPATSGVAPSSTNCIVGRGCAFNGSSQFLNSEAFNVGKRFTVSAWVNISPSVNNEQTIWANKRGGWNTNGFDFYVNSYQTNDGIVYFDSADGVGGNVSPRTAAHAVTFGQWHLLTGTMDGVNGAVHVYVDGLDQTINTGVDTAFQTTNYVRCGSLLTGNPGATGNLYFNGLMDEPRIEDGVRAPAWVWASWATVAGGNFATYGFVSLAPVTLRYQILNGQLVLSWTTGTLQSAPAANGPYNNVTGASSPCTNSLAGPEHFFRVKVQ
jgi:hypothetical protein